jgi:guanosine-3',5'-bis(diphosphate) 3'-pyrophosphohydrolase
MLFKALAFAEKAHRGQTRKYNTEIPYFIHPLRVMSRLRDYNHHDTNMLSAAILHDVVEDCNVSVEEVSVQFNENIASLVSELTQADKENPKLKVLVRADRHRLNVEKLKNISKDAKIIKLADRLDNLDDVRLDIPECYGFLKRRYLQESWDVLHAVEDGDGNLATTLWQKIKDLAEDVGVELK